MTAAGYTVGRGDIVVLRASAAYGVRVKRVIGLPGDTITCRDGQVWRDGARLDEPYVQPGSRTDCTAVTVPPGRLYVLGDHRLVSQDSRQDGPLPGDDVQARVRLF